MRHHFITLTLFALSCCGALSANESYEAPSPFLKADSELMGFSIGPVYDSRINSMSPYLQYNSDHLSFGLGMSTSVKEEESVKHAYFDILAHAGLRREINEYIDVQGGLSAAMMFERLGNQDRSTIGPYAGINGYLLDMVMVTAQLIIPVDFSSNGSTPQFLGGLSFIF